MSGRRLWSSTVIYSFADVAVLAVGGLLLLPLYTRTLTQEEFGVYVIVRANIEIFTYAICFGLPTAMARVYFDYRAKGEQRSYVFAVLLMFCINLTTSLAIMAVWGESIWLWLSPRTPVWPWMWFSVAIAAVGFFSAISAVLLRVEGHARGFVTLQVGTSIAIAIGATLALVVMHAGLAGLLTAFLLASALSGAFLPWIIGSGGPITLRAEHVRQSMHYAAPVVLGYLSHFALNRISMLVLQRHSEVAQIGIFGLAQQLATILIIAANAFGKAYQPAVFGASPDKARMVMDKGLHGFSLVMLAGGAVLILAAPELFAAVAPRSYGAALGPFLILAIGGLAYSFTIVSDTVILYARKPAYLAATTFASAAAAAILALALIPRFQLYGASMAVAGGHVCAALLGYVLARRCDGPRYFSRMLGVPLAACAVASVTIAASSGALSYPASVGLRVLVAASVLALLLKLLARERAASMPRRAAVEGESWA